MPCQCTTDTTEHYYHQYIHMACWSLWCGATACGVAVCGTSIIRHPIIIALNNKLHGQTGLDDLDNFKKTVITQTTCNGLLDVDGSAEYQHAQSLTKIKTHYLSSYGEITILIVMLQCQIITVTSLLDHLHRLPEPDTSCMN